MWSSPKLLTPRKMMEVVRTHWSIENHLHWTLDVVFDEDGARSRKNYAPENLAVIRRLALNILRTHPMRRSINGQGAARRPTKRLPLSNSSLKCDSPAPIEGAGNS